MTDIATPRFQLAVLAAILFLGLQSVAMPTIISAAEQEMPRRHSLIHRSAVESAALPATTQGTMLQPPSTESTRITSPIGQPNTSVSLRTMPLAHHQTLTKRPAIASTTAPAASAGSGSAPSFSRSRSALNLLQNSKIASLLQPPTTVVITPPSLPPPSTPPSTPPPSPSTGIVTLTWTANREPDLAGYKIYVGTASGTYNFPGSAFLTGNVRSYTVSNLPKGQTYFFAISAYDSAGNESALSAEVSKSLY